jgi:hopene-associated glycosyltransferase HpnB
MLMALGAAGLAAWLYLLILHHHFWRADQRLGPAAARASWPAVTAIVPARDEAATIAHCIDALAEQDYPGLLRVIVVDDGSTDGTGEIARHAASGLIRRIDIVEGELLPEGWSGKLWALDRGLRHAALEAPAPYVWFTDADIAHPPGILRQLVSAAEAESLDLVSLMVKLHCLTFWERLLVPAFVFFFQMLYPFPAVNDPRSRIAGAAGGCILLRSAALERIGGIGAIRGRLIDDCALGTAVKRSGGRLWLGLADESISLRESSGLDDLWRMVTRTAFTQLRYSVLLLIGTMAGLAVTFLLPPLLFLGWPLHQQLLPALMGGLTWALMAYAYAPTEREYRQPLAAALALPLAAALYAAMTVHSAVNHWTGATSRWKDREYQKSHTSQMQG